jgi:hypothetical protein
VQSYNSSSGERDQFQKSNSIDTSTPGGQRFAAAYLVIKKNCVGCHQIMNIANESDWVDLGYVTRNSPTTSVLYCRINGSNCGAGDMPQNNSLSNSDLQIINNWITGM